MKRMRSVAFAAASAVCLSACNSAGYYYHSTGPWGPPDVYRNPPRYSAPWGAASDVPVEDIIERRPFYLDAGGMDPVLRDVTPPPGRAEFVLPPDPTPPGIRPQIGSYGSGSDADAYPNEIKQGHPLSGQPEPVRKLAATPLSSPIIPPPTSPSSYAGTWKATDDKGRSCRVQLSTATTLDVYKASTSGCSSPSLQSVNLWNFSGSNVTLYFREKIVARLSGQEADLAGTLEAGQGGVRMTR